MLTICLRESIPGSLVTEADDLNISINELVLTKTLRRVDRRTVPAFKGCRCGGEITGSSDCGAEHVVEIDGFLEMARAWPNSLAKQRRPSPVFRGRLE